MFCAEVARRAFISAPQRAVLDALPGARGSAAAVPETPIDVAAGSVRCHTRHLFAALRVLTQPPPSAHRCRHRAAALTCRSKSFLPLATNRRLRRSQRAARTLRRLAGQSRQRNRTARAARLLGTLAPPASRRSTALCLQGAPPVAAWCPPRLTLSLRRPGSLAAEEPRDAHVHAAQEPSTQAPDADDAPMQAKVRGLCFLALSAPFERA